jgi:hypothetical protein
MIDSNKTPPEFSSIPSANRAGTRKIYRKSTLTILGDLRTLTLGGSPGMGESGAGGYPELPGPGHTIPLGFPQPDSFPRPGDPNWPPPQP